MRMMRLRGTRNDSLTIVAKRRAADAHASHFRQTELARESGSRGQPRISHGSAKQI